MKSIKFWTIFVVTLASLSLASCKTAKPAVTVIPQPVIEVQPSWDKNEQNSGILSYEKGFGFKITETAAKRYNHLVKTYGATQIPPVEVNSGIVEANGAIFMSNEAMVNFILFTQKSRMGD